MRVVDACTEILPLPFIDLLLQVETVKKFLQFRDVRLLAETSVLSVLPVPVPALLGLFIGGEKLALPGTLVVCFFNEGSSAVSAFTVKVYVSGDCDLEQYTK